MKYLNIFENKNSHDNSKPDLDFYTSLFLEEDEVLVARKTNESSIEMNPVGDVGDIAIYDGSKVGYVKLINLETAASGTPIGICVVPSSHNVYGDNKGAVVSLIEHTSAWSTDMNEIPGLKVFPEIVSVGNNDELYNEAKGVVVPIASYLPSDKFLDIDGGLMSTDGIGKYSRKEQYSPSPYSTDGVSRNSVYYQTSSPSTDNNCLSDLNGLNTTKKLIEISSEIYVAAKYCNTYSIEGTKQGDWYLPSIGEMGYLCSRRKLIEDSITGINNVFSMSLQLFSNNESFWSSTLSETGIPIVVNLSDGLISIAPSISEMKLRAFMKL